MGGGAGSARPGRGNCCNGRPELRMHLPSPWDRGEELEPGSDSPDTLPVTVMAGIPVGKPVRLPAATRNPMLLLRLSGSFLMRYAERRLISLLFHAPPRRTRPLQPDPVRTNRSPPSTRRRKARLSAVAAWAFHELKLALTFSQPTFPWA